ncbi:hypothetical protein ACIHFE_27925 [Streptomyces sp. NPDC052396]|uniref:SCO6745 family protein n=1 Tax=Streptomyces sp. NPDC052396 TaxID=3365689 RepID=UPI0037CE5D70
MSDARALWQLFEPIHAVTYFAPEAKDAFEKAGLRGFWRGYFAGRAAPLGPVGPEPVTASFLSFAPGMVARALPSVWEITSPGQALEARRLGARATLARLLAGREREVEKAAGLLGERVRELDCGGRVLAAANAALGLPVDPLDRLWQAATLLREHRGDGHVAALIAAGLDGCEVLVLRAGIDVPRPMLQPNRGWTDEEWDAAARRLVERGLLGVNGTATDAGRELLADVEDATDLAAGRLWQGSAAGELTELLRPLGVACAAVLPDPNPMGLRLPSA